MVTDKASVLVYSLMLIVLLAGVESQGRREPPNTELYFTLNGTVYLPGDTILITDIGIANVNDFSDHGTSLECVTTNVNTHCCRSTDNPNGGSRGEWYLPDGTRIINSPDINFYRTRYNQTVRLNRRNNAMSPTGVFTCEVPNGADSTKPHTATITIDPLLNVMLNGSGGTLTAGQNHMLTCEASGGGSMAYTYMWLRNGSVVSGQTSSTYSFSPLLVVHSGQYNCQVTVGTMNVTSRSVSITVVATPTQLYFTWRGSRYEPGDSVLITDIGIHVTSGNNIGPGDSLVCVTADVNTQCCTDTGEGQWFFPNGSVVPRNIDTSTGTTNLNSQIIRTGRTSQLRLNFRTRQASPTGEYTCVVPETGGLVNQTAGIRLVTELPVSINPSTSTTTPPPPPPPTTTTTTTTLPPPPPPPTTTTTPLTTQPIIQPTTPTTASTTTTMTAPTATTKMTPLTVMVVSNGSVLSAGQNHTLACEASGGGSMAYTYTWLKDGSAVSGQTSFTYSFSPLLVADSGQYSCQVSDGSMTVTSENVTITVDLHSPRHPESVIVTSTTPTGVTIQWMLTEPFNATRPETFVVLYGTTQNGLTRTSTSMVIATATTQTYSIQLNSLDVGTQYYFQVQSRNRFRSVVSNVMDFTTDDKMSGPVRDLQTNSPDDFTLVISWRPPTTPNGNIISYTVRIDNLRDGTTLRDIVDPSAVTTSLTENGLVPGVPYHVSVVAVNRAGQGNITTLTNFTKELEPTHAPKNIKVDRIYPTVMVVSWTPLTLSEARGFIISYNVFYSPQVSRRKRQEPNTMQKTVSGDVSQTTIVGLGPNTAYDVQMSANTKAGASSITEVISIPVPPGTGDGDSFLIVLILVIVMALVVILVMGFVIILLVLLVLRMQRTAKTRNKELVELRIHNIADKSDIYEIIDKEQDERRDETFSEIKSPPTTDTTNSQSKVEGLALSQCPAYVPVNSPSAVRGEEDVEDK